MKEVLDNSPFSASFDGPLNRLAEMLGDSRRERKEHLQKVKHHFYRDEMSPLLNSVYQET